MGTSINWIIPKEKEYSLEEIKQKLNDVFKSLKTEFLHLEQFGYFTEKERGNWFVILLPAQFNEPEYITGENDSFRIDIYKNVVIIGCMERFSGLYDSERNISKQLFKIIIELAKIFSDSNCLISSGGIGETDHVIDMGYYKNADFGQIFNKMVELNGAPAKNLEELRDKSWCLLESIKDL